MKLNITNIISDFLASRINLFLLDLMLYSLLFYTIGPSLSTSQMIFVLVLLVIINTLTNIRGVTKGMIIATIHREQMEEEIAKMLNDNEENNDE